MAEPVLSRLFREEHVQSLAVRFSDEPWDVLRGRAIRDAIARLRGRQLTGEANTREKIIEPILYDVLGFRREENDSEHAIPESGAGGGTGGVEYFFKIDGVTVPVEAKAWGKPLDRKDSSGRSPARQAWDYAGLSNSRWFIVTNGEEWRLYKKELRGSESPLSACERFQLDDLIEDRRAFGRFLATFRRNAFQPNRDGDSDLDELRRKNEEWQAQIGDALYAKLVDCRVLLFRAIQPQFAALSQEQVNDAVVKLLFRILFILFGEDTPLLPDNLLHRGLIKRYDEDARWGTVSALYSYIQRYFAWIDGREDNGFGIFPYDGALFDHDPVLDDPALRIDDQLLRRILGQLSQEAGGHSLDYSRISPRILGNIYEQFLGYVIEIKEGRVDPHADRDTRRREGSFYTPESVTKFLVDHCVSRALTTHPDRAPWELRCIDAACGSGHFLVEYVNRVAAASEERDDSRSLAQWKRYVTEHCVFGVDKDPTAVMLTKLSLWINSAMKDEPFAVVDTHIKCGNSLVCGRPMDFRFTAYERKHSPRRFKELQQLRKSVEKLEHRTQDDRRLLSALDLTETYREIRQRLMEIEEIKRPEADRASEELRTSFPDVAGVAAFHWPIEFAEVFEEQGGFDVMVGNPPWGADLAALNAYLRGGAFDLARGQYDSYELFVELGRRLLRERGTFGFIVPDSITLPEHEPLRRMLLAHTKLTRLVRLGEGIFPGVYRGAFLLCFDNEPPTDESSVRVATLRKADRQLLEQDTLFDRIRTISDAVEELGHDVPSGRFAENPRGEFDILTTTVDAPIVARIDAPVVAWQSLTTKGRGVEIGKSGEVLQCPYCYLWDNVPRRTKGKWQSKTCRHCGRSFAYEQAAKVARIISEKRPNREWRPLIPGESVNRYWVGPTQFIDCSKEGIHYKSPEFYRGQRLLVRQTGVGIYATIDSSKRMTNQSVLSWKLRDDLSPELSPYRLEYVLGVLNSRLMLYRYYTKLGDTEWRSFPRWTQELVQELPVRAVDFSDSRQRALHNGIAERVATVVAAKRPPTDREDYEIEALVMQSYGITRPMCRRIFDVLGRVQRLRVIREMNVAQPDMLMDRLPP